MNCSFTFLTHANGLKALLSEIQATPQFNALNERQQFEVSLVLEELGNELLQHLNPQCHDATLEALFDPQNIAFKLKFFGNGENWIEDAPKPDLISGITQRVTRGMGIHMAKQHCSYLVLILAEKPGEYDQIQWAIKG